MIQSSQIPKRWVVDEKRDKVSYERPDCSKILLNSFNLTNVYKIDYFAIQVHLHLLVGGGNNQLSWFAKNDYNLIVG